MAKEVKKIGDNKYEIIEKKEEKIVCGKEHIQQQIDELEKRLAELKEIKKLMK